MPFNYPSVIKIIFPDNRLVITDFGWIVSPNNRINCVLPQVRNVKTFFGKGGLAFIMTIKRGVAFLKSNTTGLY